MTTTPTPSINVVLPTGSAVGPFPTGWKYADPADVWIYIETGGVAGPDLVDGVDYTLTATDPQASGGSVTLAAPAVPVGGWTTAHRLIIRRWTARRQGVALPDTEGHKPRATERALDRAMRIAEEQTDELDLTIKAAPGTTPPTALQVAQAATLGAQLEASKADKDLENATVTQAAPFAEPRTYYAKAREFLTVEDFDKSLRSDQVALEYALAAAADANGSLDLVGMKARVIEGNLQLPAKIKWRGPLASPDTPLESYNFDNSIGVLKVASTASIQMGNESTLEAWRIMRLGLDAPYANLSAALAGKAAMAGTAVTNAGTGCNLNSLQILGFNKAFRSTVGQRVNLRHLRADCVNGFEIIESADGADLFDVRCWPFLTANQGFEGGSFASYDVLAREGQAFKFDGVTGGAIQDWFNATNCFSYGYLIGFNCEGGDHGSFLNCAADQVSQLALAGGSYLARMQETIGFKVGPGSRNITITDARAAAQGRSFLIQTTGDGGTVAIISPRSWAPIVRHVHHVSGSMALTDNGGLEPQTAGEIAAGYPNGHRILIEDTATAASVTFNRLNPPVIEGTGTALAKVTIHGDVNERKTGLGSLRFPNSGGGQKRAGTAAAFVYSESFITATEDRAIDAGGHKTMSGYGVPNPDPLQSSSGDGNEFAMSRVAIIPPGPAYTAPLGVGPGYNTGGWQQNTLKTVYAASMLHERESYYVANRGDGQPALIFNDGVGYLSTSLLRGVGIRGWGIQINLTTGAGSTSYSVPAEFENFCQANKVTSYTSHLQALGVHIVAVGDNILVDPLIPGNYAHGYVTKGLAFAARDGGRYGAMIYTDPSFVTDSFMRVEGTFTMRNILNQVVMAWGTMTPRAASDLIWQAVKPSQIYTLRQIADITPTGQIMDIYQSIDPTQEYSVSHGLHMESGEYRWARGEGLNIGVGFPSSDIMVAFAQDRWGFGASPAVAGGENLIYLKNGLAPTAGAPGISDGAAIVVLSGVIHAKSGDGTLRPFTLGPAI